MIVVLVALVIASCTTQYVLTHLAARSTNRTVQLFVGMLRHEQDLRRLDNIDQHEYNREELASRERLAMMGMRTPIVPQLDNGNGYGVVDNGAYSDPDPLQLDELPNVPIPPSHHEQLLGGFDLPPDRSMVGYIRPGESIIPGMDNGDDEITVAAPFDQDL